MFYCVLNAGVKWATTIGVNRSPDDSILSPPCDPEAENERDFPINPKSKSPDPFDFSPKAAPHEACGHLTKGGGGWRPSHWLLLKWKPGGMLVAFTTGRSSVCTQRLSENTLSA